MRIALRLLGALALLALLVAALAWWSLAPLTPMDRPAQSFRLANVTVIEPGIGRSADRELVARGGEIASLGPAAQDVDRYDGHFVLPGLVDAHVHFPPATLGQAPLFTLLFLAHGITAVRDAGDYDGTTTAPARDGLRSGALPGPRIRACGPFLDGRPPGQRNALVVLDAEDAKAAVARVHEQGFDCLKVYNELEPAPLAAIREAARARGLPVIGHVPWRVPYEEARLDDVQHLTHLPGSPAAFEPYPGVMHRWLGLGEERLDEVVAASVAHGIAATPTLVATERRIAFGERYEQLRASPEAALVPRFFRDVIWSPTRGLADLRRQTADDTALLAAALPQMQRAVKRLFAAGVPLRTGTDSMIAFVVPGASLHRELRLFVGAGLTPEEALAVSTRDSAAALGLRDPGRVAPGARADLVIFRRDPTVSLDALAEISGVAVDGRLYSREALDRELERHRARFEGGLYDAVLTRLVERALAERG